MNKPIKETDDNPVHLDFSNASFGLRETYPYKSLAGFTSARKHTVPTDSSRSADEWARRLMQPKISEDLQYLYKMTKKTLGLKSRDIIKKDDEGSGSIDTDYFSVDVTSGQNPEAPSEVFSVYSVVLKVSFTELPENFDNIFPFKISNLYIPLYGAKDNFEDLVDQLEDRIEGMDIEMDDNPTTGIIYLIFSPFQRIVIDTSSEKMTIEFRDVDGCLALIKHLDSHKFRSVMGNASAAIGSGS